MEGPQKHRFTLWPSNPFLGTQSKETKTGFQQDICTPTLISALVTTAKRWKQLKCPSIDEWAQKTQHKQTPEREGTLPLEHGALSEGPPSRTLRQVTQSKRSTTDPSQVEPRKVKL